MGWRWRLLLKPICWATGHEIVLIERTSPQTAHVRCVVCGGDYGRHRDLNGWGPYMLPWSEVSGFYAEQSPDGFWWPDRAPRSAQSDAPDKQSED